MNVSTLLLFYTLLINTVLYGLNFNYIITIVCHGGIHSTVMARVS